MEKSIESIYDSIKETFALGEVDAKTYSPLVLAYIGDGIYELIIRSILVGQGNVQVNRIHKKASSLVKASAQSMIFEMIKEELTAEELQIFKRGRNANSGTMAKHASMSDYRRATGLETLMGYLYIKGDLERAIWLVKQGLNKGELTWDMKN